MFKIVDWKLLALVVTLVVGQACSGLESQGTAEKEPVKLPSKVQNVSQFNEASVGDLILILTQDNELYEEQIDPLEDTSTKTEITEAQLSEKLKSAPEPMLSDEKIVYLKVDSGVRFENVIAILRLIREAEISWVGLLTEKKADWGDEYKGLLEVRLQTRAKYWLVPDTPEWENFGDVLLLVVRLDESGSLRANWVEGVLDTLGLTERLSSIFKARDENNTTGFGENRKARMVHLEASGSSEYGDVVRVIDAMKGSGADPIVILGLIESEPTPTTEAEDDEPMADDDYHDNTNS